MVRLFDKTYTNCCNLLPNKAYFSKKIQLVKYGGVFFKKRKRKISCKNTKLLNKRKKNTLTQGVP